MKCFAPEQLPVLTALAQEFAVCDNWHVSMPGPTWPNRMFVHAASSGGLDHSPTTEEIVEWETIGGFQFKAGSAFDALKKKAVSRRLYAGDDFPMVAALKGISLFDIRHYSNFASDLANQLIRTVMCFYRRTRHSRCRPSASGLSSAVVRGTCR
jgi:phospholipase C